MKCPNCGHWNRASFPRCFRCGAELPREEDTQLPADQIEPGAPSRYLRGDDTGALVSESDEREALAREMRSYHERKSRGERGQRRLREQSAELGRAPSSMTVKTYTRRGSVFNPPEEIPYAPEDLVEGDVRPDAISVTPERRVDYDDYAAGSQRPLSERERDERDRERARVAMATMRRVRRSRIPGLSRARRILALILAVAALGFGGYEVYTHFFMNEKTPSLQERTSITPSILDEMAAHIIRIPAPEGAQIYIKELRKSYIVTGGYATIEVADYTWYAQNPSEVSDSMLVTLTPYLKTGAGEQTFMETLTYTLDIPLSPLTLVDPDVPYLEVSTAIYNIKVQVEKDSTVTINGEDFSDLVNTQDGLITYNATVLPIGDNVINIRVRSQYYRENTKQIILYRAVQDIPLDLQSDLGSTSSSSTKTINATTMPGATITVLSPYQNLNTSKLASTGEFSFDAVFKSIGTNTIIISAQYPGKETTTVKYDVYYVPTAAVYTPKAWSMKAYDYSELLGNISRRAANTQIYVCIGKITEIISTKPQLAIMTLDDEDGTERQLMLENKSTDTWVVGERYRVYADVFGLYNSIPRLVARYTYKPYN